MPRVCVVCIITMFFQLLHAEELTHDAPTRNAFGLQEDAFAVRLQMSGKELENYIKERLARPEPITAYGLCLTAELMKHAGDPRADEFYRRAIERDPLDPAYELFYADYLRNYRGPQKPLFPQAERHYWLARRKFEARGTKAHPAEKNEELNNRIDRGMVALYQRDGVPILPPRFTDSQAVSASLLFSGVNRYAESLTDFDEVDDIRNFSSEAAFAQSPTRLNRRLTDDELRRIIRKKPQWETFNRVRLRDGDIPAIDVFYRHRDIQEAQVTQFFAPNEFNDVRLDEYGIAASQAVQGEAWDLYYGAAYRRIERRGIVEFLPAVSEDIDQLEGSLGGSRYAGQDKFNIDGIFVYQNIRQDVANSAFRDRFIYGGTVSYQIYRKLPFLRLPGGERFETRGVSIYIGAVEDAERYDRTTVVKGDVFAGVALKGLGRFDLTFQSSIFTSSVENDKTQDNCQYRADVNILFRLLDEEKTPGIPKLKLFGLRPAFVHLVLPLKQDIALQGIKAYENYRAGVELDAKFIVRGFHGEITPPSAASKYRGMTFLVSARCDRQWFHRLDKEVNLFSFSASLGF